MKILRAFLVVLARLFVSSVFLAGGVKNILTWNETEAEVMSLLLDWQSYVGFSETLRDVFAYLAPWATILLMGAVALMLAGGLLILLGIRERLGTIFLILFLVPVTVLYHPFWFFDGLQREMQSEMFLKNLAILGCLIQLLMKPQEKESFVESRDMSINFS